MRIFYRIVEEPGGNQPGRMRHVDHKDGAHFICNFTHAFVIPFARVCRTAADNHFRTFAQGNFLHLIVVYTAGFLIKIIFAWSIDDTGSIYQRTVRKVSAVCQVQSHKFISRIQNGKEHGCIGLCAGVWLYIGPFGAKNLLQPVDSDLFALVYHLATAVVTLAGIAFGIFIGKAGAHCLHYLVTHKVF